MTKALRFASLIRVSSEAQEKKGESLQTQRQGNERDVERLGGKIVEVYGGQEHATPGEERKELDRLLSDARKKKFDAVMVQYADRWSRDNKKSKEGLEVFRNHSIRFFVGTTEMDLFDPQHRFVLGMHAEVGEFIAMQQAKKSLESKIARAKAGRPACGKLPPGRTFNYETGEWGIDAGFQAMIEDAARRYLAGENIRHIAKEKGVNASHLHKTLNHLSGEIWEQTFTSKRLNISEKAPTKIPRLLAEKTIKAIRQRAAGNRTYGYGPDRFKHRWLLGGMVLCSHCNRALHGQHTTKDGTGRRYYRHSTEAVETRKCPHRCAWVRADRLEDEVMEVLFATFGNAVAVQQAIDAATPNADKIAEARDRLQRVEADLEKVKVSKERVIRFISKGTISEKDAEKELSVLKDREALLARKKESLRDEIEHAPTREDVAATAEKVAGAFNKGRAWAQKESLDRLSAMTWDDRRALCQTVFGGKDRDGKRLGVYVSHHGRGDYRFRVKGLLLEDWEGLWRPITGDGPDESDSNAPLQGALLGAVVVPPSSAPRTPMAPGSMATRAGSAPATTASTSRATTRTRRRRGSTTGSTRGASDC